MESQDNNINIIKKLCDCQNVKYLSSGGNGSVYLVIVDDEKFIYKIEKMDKYDENNILTSEYYRQIEFDRDVAINYPNKFLVLKNHGLITDCTYEHPKYKDVIKKLSENNNLHPRAERALKRFIRKNSQRDCYWLVYVPYLDGSYNEIQTQIYNDDNLFLDFLYQVIDSINIMKTNGYAQNDLNPNNIMYKKIRNKYRWYIIDYGYVYNNKFPMTEMDINLQKRDLFGMDLATLICFCVSPNLFKFMDQTNIKEDETVFATNIVNENIYEHIQIILNKFESKAHIIISIAICQILEPHTFLKCLLVPKKVYKKYKNDQLFPELLIYCLEHHKDETYNNILVTIKTKLLGQKAGQIYYDKYIKYKTKYISLKNP